MTSSTDKETIDDLADRWRQLWLDNMATMTRQTVESDVFKNANAAWLNWALAGQKMVRDSSAQTMELLDLPRRSDLARLSRQVAALEARVLELQEQLEELPTKRDLERLERLLKQSPPRRAAKK